MIGLNVKKVATTRGGEYAGPCPKCGGSDRFRCWPDDKGGHGSYWCRQCGIGGDTVQLLVDYVGYSYPEAFKATGRERPQDFRVGTWKPKKTQTEKPFEPKSYETPGEAWREKATAFISSAHDTLLGCDSVLKYLHGRGLDLEAVKRFRLGYFPGEKGKACMYRPRSAWGLPRVKKKNGRDKMLWIPRGIVIPSFQNGVTDRIRIRRPKPDLQARKDVKYYIVPGSGMAPMLIDPGQKALVVVESELDGMLVSRHTEKIAGVVALGSASAKPGACAFPYLQKTLRILVALDFDQAGIKAWQWWGGQFRNARQWPVPVGKDPGEAFEQGMDIKEWVFAGLPAALKMVHGGMNLPDHLRPPQGLYPIEELRFFLKRLPIKILATHDKTKIIYGPEIKNQWIKDRMKALFFGDDEVFYFFIHFHPDKIINGNNCDWVPPIRNDY